MTYTLEIQPLDAEGKRGEVTVTLQPGGNGFVALALTIKGRGKAKPLERALGSVHVTEIARLARALEVLTEPPGVAAAGQALRGGAA